MVDMDFIKKIQEDERKFEEKRKREQKERSARNKVHFSICIAYFVITMPFWFMDNDETKAIIQTILVFAFFSYLAWYTYREMREIRQRDIKSQHDFDEIVERYNRGMEKLDEDEASSKNS
jgi:hypothetical protein